MYIRPVFLGILSILLLFAITLNAQVKYQKEPSWVQSVNFKANTDISRYTDQISGGILYLLVDTQDNIDTEERYIHRVYKLTSTVGIQNNSVVSMEYDPSYQKLIFHKILIHRNGGTINKLNPEKMQVIQRESDADKLIYDGTLTAYLHLDDVREGDVIEYACTVKGRNPAYQGKFFTLRPLNYDVPVHHIVYSIIAPRERTLYYKTLNLKSEPVISEYKQEKIYKWQLNHVDALVTEDFIPVWYNPYIRVMVTEFRNWKELNMLFLDMFDSNQTSGQVDYLVRKISSQYKTKAEQINAAIHYVQNNIRYLGLEEGISAYEPGKPEKIMKQGFGDCKDKSLLLCTILRQMGVEAYPAFVNTNTGKHLDDYLPGPGIFDHCVVKLIFDNKDIWIDPTITHQGGLLTNKFFPNYFNAFVISPYTKSLESIRTKTIANVEVKEKILINDFEGDVYFYVSSRYYGNEADTQRRLFDDQSKAEISKNFLNYYSRYYANISVNIPVQINDDSINNVFYTEESYKIRDFWTKSDNSDLVEATIYKTYIHEYFISPEVRIRKMPFYLEHPRNISVNTKILLPGEWSIAPENKHLTGPGIKFSYKSIFDDGVLDINYKMESTSDHITPKDMSEYIKTLDKLGQYIGLLLQNHYTPFEQVENLYEFNWLVLVVFIAFFTIIIIGSFYIHRAFDPFNLNVKYAYDTISGWMYLPFAGIILTLILTIARIVGSNYFTNVIPATIFNAHYSGYNPLSGFILFGELLLNGVLIVYHVLLIIQFLKHRSSFPTLFAVFLVINFMLNLYLILFRTDPSTDFSLITSFFMMVIWLPVFIASTRVKETFVVQHIPKEQENNTHLS